MSQEQQKVKQALSNVIKDSSHFILIGLTGRTGSGCSTSAKILSSKYLPLPEVQDSHFMGKELIKYRIVKKFIEKKWTPFIWLQIRSVITWYILKLDYPNFILMISNILNETPENIKNKLTDFEDDYVTVHSKISSFLDLDEEAKRKKYFELFFNTVTPFSNTLRDALKTVSLGAYTKVYQQVGDNIRSSGHAEDESFKPEAVFGFAKTINKVIKSANQYCRDNNTPCRIVIDAIRNPYESAFFTERYSNYYQVSINTKNANRLHHLKESHKFTDQQIKDLDTKEYPSKLKGYKKYTSQNIQKCIELSDIHINNPRDSLYGNSELMAQLAWYVSLMLHPGIVMPNSMESCMQIAYSVKKNSGCISRQVGAVMTDDIYSVKSVGWNNTPQGQVPCLLRNAEDLIAGNNSEIYSIYENNNTEFRGVLKSKFSKAGQIAENEGLNLSFCFKDIQNEVEGEKNQVHTRALHAEESAILQISKFGGQMLKGGILLTTASPCELCAKKAYQIGVSKIIYIDPYPGISTSHVLSQGDNSPELVLFRGAVGRAFHQLYQPMMPFKEELEIILNIPKKDKSLEIQRLKERLALLERED